MSTEFTYSDFERLLKFNAANFNQRFTELLDELRVKTLRIDKISPAAIDLCKVRVRVIGELAWVAMTEIEFAEFFEAMKVQMGLQCTNTYVRDQVELFTFPGYTVERQPEMMLLYRDERTVVRYKDFVESLIKEEKGYRTGDVVQSEDFSYVVTSVTGSESPYTDVIVYKDLREVEVDDMGFCTSSENTWVQRVSDFDDDPLVFSGIKLRRW